MKRAAKITKHGRPRVRPCRRLNKKKTREGERSARLRLVGKRREISCVGMSAIIKV